MATSQDIGWGTYQEYEGPFHQGKASFLLHPRRPVNPEKRNPGGHHRDGEVAAGDAYNGYDRCICTSEPDPVVRSGAVQRLRYAPVRSPSGIVR